MFDLDQLVVAALDAVDEVIEVALEGRVGGGVTVQAYASLPGSLVREVAALETESSMNKQLEALEKIKQEVLTEDSLPEFNAWLVEERIPFEFEHQIVMGLVRKASGKDQKNSEKS